MATVRLKGEARKAQVVDTALRIIGRDGLGALTTSALAREAGISEANLYRHFADKDAILQAVAQEIRAGLERNLELLPAASPLEALGKIYALHLEYIERNEGIPRLLFSEQLHLSLGMLKEQFLDTINSYAGRLAGYVRDGQRAGLIKKEVKPRAAALMLIGMVQVMTLRWSLSGFSFPLAREGMKLWKNFERCVATK